MNPTGKYVVFLSNTFDFSLVDIDDPMDLDKSTSQTRKDAAAIVDQAPSHQSIVLAAQKDFRARGFNDAAHVLSLLADDPVAMGKKIRDFLEGKGQVKSKPLFTAPCVSFLANAGTILALEIHNCENYPQIADHNCPN